MWNVIAGKIAMETKGAVNSVRDLDDELDRVRATLVAGSDAANQFENSISDSAREQASMVKRTLGIAALAAKTAAVNLTSGLASKLGMKELDKMGVTQKNLLDAEDDIATTLMHQKFTQQELLALSEKQEKLEQLKRVYYNQAATMDRERVNAAMEAIGEQERAQELLRIQIKEQKDLGNAELYLIAEKVAGRGRLGQMMKSEIEWQHQINQAYREGNNELGKALTAQRNLDLAQQLASQKRQTTRDRIDERRNARRLDSDAKKQIKRNEELDRSILRGARGSAGSRLEERRRQNAARNLILPNQPGAKADSPDGPILREIKTFLSDIKNNTEATLTVERK